MIVAIDPGQHTGMAFRLDNGEWATLMADKLPDANERLAMVLDTLLEYMRQDKLQLVVIENFKTMGYLSRFGIETIELVGAIKALCHSFGVSLVRQDPVHRLPFERTAMSMVKERAKELKLTVSDHEISALSHLLRYEYHQLQTSGAPSAGNASRRPGSTSDTSPLTNGPIGFVAKPVKRSAQGGQPSAGE